MFWMLLVACHHRTPEVRYDGQPYAVLEGDGWHHVPSGELALPYADGEVTALGRVAGPSEFLVCDETDCFIAPRWWRLRGRALILDGVVRGEVLHASEDEARSAVLLMQTYQPPAARVATYHDTEVDGPTYTVAALPDGRLVEGRPLAFPQPALDLPVVGEWNETGVRVGDQTATYAEDIVDQPGGRRLVVLSEWAGLVVEDGRFRRSNAYGDRSSIFPVGGLSDLSMRGWPLDETSP
ncbi:MAG: hypothetical protein KC656_32000, partial [Myxococcales bacterium]|nr:hypothetical protein [Myxococcales bacterium]